MPSTESEGTLVSAVIETATEIALRQFAEVLKTLTQWGEDAIMLRVAHATAPSLAASPLAALPWAPVEEVVLDVNPQDFQEPLVVILGTGAFASAGFVLLQSRAWYLLLSLLTAKPLWNQYDPMAILLDWEHEQKRRAAGGGGDEDEETLQSMVEGVDEGDAVRHSSKYRPRKPRRIGKKSAIDR